MGGDAAPEEAPDEPWPWWVWGLTMTVYIALGYRFTSLVLNWIIGPLFPLLVLYLIPRILRPRRSGAAR